MEKIGPCIDADGNTSILYTDGEKYYRENPRIPESVRNADWGVILGTVGGVFGALTFGFAGAVVGSFLLYNLKDE